MARTGKAARTAIFNRVIFFCYGVFVLSIDLWDAKVARAGIDVKVASLDWL